MAASSIVHAAVVVGLLVAAPSHPGQLTDTAAESPDVQTILSIREEPRPQPVEPPPPAPQPAPVPEQAPPQDPEPAAPPPPQPEVVAQPSPEVVPAAETVDSPPAPEPAPPAPSPRGGPPSAPASETPAPEPRRVVFAGINAKRAARIVYVVDGSGPMVSSWKWITGQLRQSLAGLDSTQQFQVLVVRTPPPAPGEPFSHRAPEIIELAAATPLAMHVADPRSVSDAVTWLSGIALRGASDALPGLARALEYRPDLIFLLSHSFRRTTPESDIERTRQAVLADLDRLNPRDATGKRAVVIKTIQFLSEDTTGVLQAIARDHGDGPGSYHVVTQAELNTRRQP